MVESEEVPSDPSKLGSTSELNVPKPPLQKRSLQIEGGISLDRPLGYSRRKVCATRDFPPHFGRNVLGINGKMSDLGPLGLAGVSVRSELPKLLKDSDQDPLKPETVELLVCSDQNGFLRPPDDLEVEMSNRSELMALPSSLGKTEPLDSREANVHMLDMTEPMDSREANVQMLDTTVPMDSQEATVHVLDTTEPMDSREANVHMLDTTEPVEAAEENVPKIYPPPRRISSHRDFPPGCGRDAQPMPEEECRDGITLGSKKAYGDGPLVEMDGTLNAINDAAGKSEGSVTKETEGEGGFLGDKLILLANISGKKQKKEEPVVGYVQGSNSNMKNEESFMRNTDSLEGKMSTRKSARISKIASQHKNKTAVKDEEDSLPHGDGEKRVPPGQELSLSSIPFGPNPSRSDDPRTKVRETLRLFQATCRKLLQKEEANTSLPAQNFGRIDLIASGMFKKEKKYVHDDGMAILGAVPGVEVGDEFQFRVELAIVGLHRPFQSGIDYLTQDGVRLATSVVASGGYADDMDSSDVLIYSGQGGKPAGGDKQAEDQKLERGNLALKNSIDAKTPVRVIHGYKELRGSDSPEAKGRKVTTYRYDGLYLIENYWQERGDHGRFVFKFQMRRLPGQPELPELVIKEIKKSETSAEREDPSMGDVSQGKEKKPIHMVNTIDAERPLPFEYITTVKYPPWYKPTVPRGCDCTDGCSDSKKCVCVNKNGGEIPFNHNGSIVEAKHLVYECGPSCKCPPSCYNRVSQHGITFKLQVFKTQSRGWGVRCLTFIPSGSFICEYAGELLKDIEAEQRISNDEYLFDIGRNHSNPSLWDGQSSLIPTESQSSAPEKVAEDGEYTIDAAKHGNVGRFINHSCSPNLYAQNVLYDHDDESKPHIMLFAAENIPPLQELTYHYNYTIGEVRDSSGNVKQKNCYCGSNECTGRLY